MYIIKWHDESMTFPEDQGEQAREFMMEVKKQIKDTVSITHKYTTIVSGCDVI